MMKMLLGNKINKKSIRPNGPQKILLQTYAPHSCRSHRKASKLQQYNIFISSQISQFVILLTLFLYKLIKSYIIYNESPY